ncbi:MAG: tetratricopeptide repeat protein [Candidatus Viridilinea halotolerans]|uniref:Tetratricopeptide repeat protein n=1 Tax=Candidatus Viridilinea halotolerans TaxID=2491704 RepID=A0A426U1V6_9CHLR|nr:MAG: tetratricopeptide repeat protein [Candidatus Viridilinea halotolerans]
MRSLKFGRLLNGAICFLARYEEQNVSVILAGLAEVLKTSDSTIERWKNEGYVPDPDSIRLLAEELTRRTPLGREWLRALLSAARCQESEAVYLIERLCPAEQGAAPLPHYSRADLPPAEYAAFVMRSEVFAQVKHALCQDLPAVVIVGMGGNGKSSLAREVALHAMNGYEGSPPFAFVAWVSDKVRPGGTHLATVLDSIARRLSYPAYVDLPLYTKRERITELLRMHRLLLVLDNAETINDSELLTWLNQIPPPSKVLVTTRLVPEHLHGAIVELHGMTSAEVYELVQQRLRMMGLGALEPHPGDLAALIRVTHGNPKAIAMALGLMKVEGRTLEEATASLAAHEDIFDDLFVRFWGMLNSAARRLLLVAPFFPESASMEALGASANVGGQELRRAIHHLTEISLLDVAREQISRPPRYALHPLVRAFALAQLHKDEALEIELRLRWRDFLRLFIHQHIVRPEPAALYWQTISVADMSPLDPEQANLFAVLEWADHADERGTIIEFMLLLVHYMERRALYNLREQYGRRAIAAALADTRTADAAILSIDALGWLFFEQDRLDEAAEVIEKGLALAAQLPQDDAQRQDLEALGETFLGRVAIHRGDVAKAMEHNERALCINCTSVVRSRVLWFAGELMYFQRRYVETLDFYHQSDLEALRYGGESLRSLAGTVGMVYIAMKDIDQAEQVLRAFLLEIPSELAVQRVYAVYGLAFVAFARGDHDQALHLAEEARDIIQRLRIKHRLEAHIERLITAIIGADQQEPSLLNEPMLLVW